MLYNKVVSEGSILQELLVDRPELKVEIRPMAQFNFRMSTVGHFGPIKLVLTFGLRGEGE